MSQAKKPELLHSDITDAILRGFYHVYNTLGYGFLERVYERSLMRTLQKAGFNVVHQCPVQVWFEGEVVGRYRADLIVNRLVIVEVKVEETLHPRNEAQLLNYLKATEMEVGILLNFGEKPTFRRKVFTNDRKLHLPTRSDP